MKKNKTIKFLGIPFYKVREKNGVRKKYFLGICYNKKKVIYPVINKSIVNQPVPQKDIFKLNNNELNIAFKLGGGLGDYLIAMNFVVLFRQYIGDNKIRIDVFGKTEWIDSLFKNSISVNHCYDGRLLSDNNKEYDLIIHLTREPIVISAKKNKIYDYSIQAFDLLQLYEKENCRKRKLYQKRPLLDGQLLSQSIIEKYKRYSQPDITHKLGLNEEFSYEIDIDISEQEYLNNIGLKSKNFISIHRGVHQFDSKDSVKQWPVMYYNILIEKIKKTYPDVKIVQLGFSDDRCPKFENVDINLVGKTSLEQVKVILKNSSLHIDGEGGMVHLRHALHGGKSVVMFGATAPEFYGYSENINLRGNGCSHWCEWITENWQAKCARGFDRPPCVYSLTPDIVFDVFNKIWNYRND